MFDPEQTSIRLWPLLTGDCGVWASFEHDSWRETGWNTVCFWSLRYTFICWSSNIWLTYDCFLRGCYLNIDMWTWDMLFQLQGANTKAFPTSILHHCSTGKIIETKPCNVFRGHWENWFRFSLRNNNIHIHSTVPALIKVKHLIPVCQNSSGYKWALLRENCLKKRTPGFSWIFPEMFPSVTVHTRSLTAHPWNVGKHFRDPSVAGQGWLTLETLQKSKCRGKTANTTWKPPTPVLFLPVYCID